MAKIAGETLRMLVVEDDLPIAHMMAGILTDEGFDVDLADNGRLALEMIDAQHYDLILTDLRMPELDGVTLYRELERRKSDLLRRVIVITGTSGHPEYESFLAETQVPYLEKPFGLTALLAITHQVLSTVSPSVR
ncbi:MAG TPA: response regulator [Terriglobales bacterium]|nr:response regulator [Terriglobales bacterium]